MTLTARVQNGRLVLDEPTTLPEGQLVELVIAESAMDATERSELVAALEEAERRQRGAKYVGPGAPRRPLTVDELLAARLTPSTSVSLDDMERAIAEGARRSARV